MNEHGSRGADAKATAKKVGWTALAVIVVLGLFSMLRTVELGHTDIYQNTFTKNKIIYHGPDWYFSPIYFGKERTYKDETTIVFGDGKDADAPAIDIGFADTYEADLPLSVRYRLPGDDEHMFALDKSFRSYNNLVNSLYLKTTEDVAVGTATQFTAEEVFQGGLNGIKSAVEDQIKRGLFVTERRRVQVSNSITSRVGVGGDKTKANQVEQSITVWKAVPLTDDKGAKLRMDNPFEQYGVYASQLTLQLPHPEERLNKLLVAKKESVAKKILSVQKQDNAKEDIKTAKLEGQAKRETAEQKRLIVADAEIIELKKQVKVAKQQALKEIVEQQKLADLAIIDKKKELQVAKANENIQRANSIAATHQAKAIKAKGLAEAAVKKAKYAAVRKDILELEVSKANVKMFSQNMKNFKVQMPQINISGGGDGSSVNSLDTVMNAMGVKSMQEIAAKTKK